MAKVNRDKERQRCREFYEKWDFVKRIVSLYAEGVSWKGCKVTAPIEPDRIPLQYSQIVDVGTIKNVVRDMLVEGTGHFNLEVHDSVPTLTYLEPDRVIGVPDVVLIHMPSQSSMEEAGRPFLWPAALNAKPLENAIKLIDVSPDAAMMAQILMDDMCAYFGVPRWLLLQSVVTGDPTAIKWGLNLFRSRVNELRAYLGFHMTEAVKPLVSEALNYKGFIEIAWNEHWFQSAIISAYGPVYQVFKAQGIELRTLAEQRLDFAKSLLESSLISRKTYEQSVKWFLENSS